MLKATLVQYIRVTVKVAMDEAQEQKRKFTPVFWVVRGERTICLKLYRS